MPKTAQSVGLVQKFSLSRNEQPYPPHEGEYFVLFPKKDRAALEAMVAYAVEIEDENPELAEQIHAWLGAK